MSAIVPVEPHHPDTRINDGRCDAQGRFVFGMFNAARGAPPISHFYRVTADLQIETLPLPRAGVANSIAFSPDGTLMYFTDTTPEFWQKVISVNYVGVLNGTRAALRYMIPQQRGSIVAISSDASRQGEPREAVYGGVKAAINSFMKSSLPSPAAPPSFEAELLLVPVVPVVADVADVAVLFVAVIAIANPP